MMLADAIATMVDEARSGGTVAYMGRDQSEVMRRIQALSPGGLARMSHNPSGLAAEFTTGGSIMFLSPSQHGFRGRILDAAFLGFGTPALAAEDAEIAARSVYEVV